MLGAAMSRSIGRSFFSGPKIAACSKSDHRLCRISERTLCSSLTTRHLTVFTFSLPDLLKTSIRNRSNPRTLVTYASLAQKTSWDDAADSYFSEEGVKETPTSRPPGVKKWISPANRERLDYGSNSDFYEGDGKGRTTTQPRSSEFVDTERRDVGRKYGYGGDRNRTDQRSSESVDTERRDVGRKYGHGGDRNRSDQRNSESVDTERRDVGRKSGYGGDKNRTDQWQTPARGYTRSKDGGAYSGRSGRDWQVRGKTAGSSLTKDYNRGQDERAGFGDDRRWRGQEERAGFGDDRRWQAREYSPPLPVEGQALYGVAPIISALQVSRRTFYCLYMQENLLINIGNGKRKDKAAVTAIEKMARGLGVTVKEASKHDMNMLVDNRPHQGLILDASPLELIPVDALDAPAYQDNKHPVWVALDEVTDPQNFGAILRSAYFLGAEGVVVCAKNSAPLSGVVSKASAGAMEVMEVLFCRNMMKFLDKCKENGWRVVGASAEHASVPVRELPHGLATILVLGSEGKGLRTNVKRSCDQLVSISGVLNSNQRPNYDFGAQVVEDEDLEVEVEMEEEEEGGRRGAELGLISGPSAVDSLNVSVAAGILLYELLDIPTQKDLPTLSSQ